MLPFDEITDLVKRKAGVGELRGNHREGWQSQRPRFSTFE